MIPDNQFLVVVGDGVVLLTFQRSPKVNITNRAVLFVCFQPELHNRYCMHMQANHALPITIVCINPAALHQMTP